MRKYREKPNVTRVTRMILTDRTSYPGKSKQFEEISRIRQRLDENMRTLRMDNPFFNTFITSNS